ncbi:putative small auxin-up RNA [Helianthus annuus]|uniref:Small auxin-up RNA n=1 Tax=Helianthus annuus TaxID=4232 RepID=A0A251V2T7_HELAN|nr:putative uncharacterized protein DDB_G0285119 [Helianthus annuus]KAF5767052.1 putative small auxin-up RNA [Helianthus annuus]KAJ0453354.1 putative small auxin-up RNA [Helianthus annuus]KAJ0475278.1 putative small auxin-up RNA [Helianthus annuus]KAJ0650835.1 putative small auxin-up RNA [Helianthus annuus]
MGDLSHVNQVPPPTKKSNKIRDIVRLQQMLKKWKKAATATKNNNDNNNNNNAAAPITTNNNKTTTKGLNKFLKKTLSFSDISSSSSSQQQGQEDVVKKGYLAVWVGRDEGGMKKFVIPTDYLAHQAFSVLLRDAEEEFGFQQEGILKIPCDVPLFEKILRMMSDNKKQNQRPTLKSSSSTSSFFLYEQDQKPQQPDQLLNHCSSPAPPHINTPPTTPTHNLPLYCR